MPFHDFTPPRPPHRKRGRQFDPAARMIAWIEQRFGRRRRPRRKTGEDGGVPVEPNRPNTLSGGAAAELDFED